MECLSGFDVEEGGPTGAYPLHLASFLGKDKVVRALLAAGADVKATDAFGNTALHYAIKDFTSWMQPGLQPSRVCQSCQRPRSERFEGPCHHLRVVAVLIAGGSEVPDANYGTMVSFALESMAWKTVLALLRVQALEGAFAAVRSETAKTLLALARVWNETLDRKLQARELLLSAALASKYRTPAKRCSTATACPASGERVGHLAQPAAAAPLRQSGAQATAARPKDCTPLHEACRIGNEPLVRLLLAAGADVHALGPQKTPLLKACRAGNPQIVRSLLRAGASLGPQGSRQWHPLHEACKAQQESAVQALLEEGAAVDAQGPLGMTALHLACTAGHVGIARLLLNAGANIAAHSRRFDTPAETARQRGHSELFALLVTRMAVPSFRGEPGIRGYKRCSCSACQGHNHVLLAMHHLEPDAALELLARSPKLGGLPAERQPDCRISKVDRRLVELACECQNDLNGMVEGAARGLTWQDMLLAAAAECVKYYSK